MSESPVTPPDAREGREREEDRVVRVVTDVMVKWLRDHESEFHDFLVRVDSYCSLVAYRHDLSNDVIEELKRLSMQARAFYQGPLA